VGISDVSSRTFSQHNINGAEKISKLTKERRSILKYLGKVCSQYYLIVEDG
jgi:hypothetical protein